MNCVGNKNRVLAVSALVGMSVAIAAILTVRGRSESNAALVNATGPGIVQANFAIEPESVDIGAIPVEGGVREVQMAIRNLSGTPIRLAMVSKSCGCLDVICPEKLAPQTVDKIRLTLDPKRKPGQVTAIAVISVETSAGAKVTKECTVKYDAIPSIALEPELLVVDDLGSTEIAKRHVDVFVRTPQGELPTPPTAQCDQAGITTSLMETVDRHDKNLPFRRVVHRYEIGVQAANGPGKEMSDIPVKFCSATGDSELLRLRILRRHHPILVGPTAVLVDREGPSPKTLKFWARNGQTFEVTNINSSLSWLSAELLTDGLNRIHELKILSKGTPPNGAMTPGTLRIAISGCPEEYVVNVVVRID